MDKIYYFNYSQTFSEIYLPTVPIFSLLYIIVPLPMHGWRLLAVIRWYRRSPPTPGQNQSCWPSCPGSTLHIDGFHQQHFTLYILMASIYSTLHFTYWGPLSGPFRAWPSLIRLLAVRHIWSDADNKPSPALWGSPQSVSCWPMTFVVNTQTRGMMVQSWGLTDPL